MDSAIVLENPEVVRAGMRVMDANARKRGEKYFSQGRVRNLRRGVHAGEFLAEVQGADQYAVRLVFDDEELVEEACSCPLANGCKHIYATLKALLVEHTRGHVQALSAKQEPNRQSHLSSC